MEPRDLEAQRLLPMWGRLVGVGESTAMAELVNKCLHTLLKGQPARINGDLWQVICLCTPGSRSRGYRLRV